MHPILSSLISILLTSQTVFYSDETDFHSAAPGLPVQTFDTPFAEGGSATFPGFRVSESGAPAGSNFIGWRNDTDINLISPGMGYTWDGSGALTFTFDSDVTAFGAQIIDFGTVDNADDYFVSVFSESGDAIFENHLAAVRDSNGSNLPRGNIQYFGVTSATPFRSLVFSSNPDSSNDLIIFDNVAVAVPEPGAIAMLTMVAGIISAVAFCMRRAGC